MSFSDSRDLETPNFLVSFVLFQNLRNEKLLLAERASGVPLLSKFGNLSIREILVVTSAHAPLPARIDSGGGRGVSQGNPTGVENVSFSWREIV